MFDDNKRHHAIQQEVNHNPGAILTPEMFFLSPFASTLYPMNPDPFLLIAAVSAGLGYMLHAPALWQLHAHLLTRAWLG